MGRLYHRKTNKGADSGRYTREELNRAVSEVKEGKSALRSASKKYSIPRTTLRHYVNGTRGQGSVACKGKGGGGKPALPKKDQDNLAELIKCMERWGFGLSRHEIFEVVEHYVQGNSIKTTFKNNRPGESWFLKFCKDYRLSIKKPQGVEYVRVSQVNPYVINAHFDLLEKVIMESDLVHRPELIFNLDETSFCNDPSKTKVVGAKGFKATRTISSAGRENTSVLICGSASGQKMPPLVIFKGKNIIETYISKNLENQISVAVSKRGWMESELFCSWFSKCFIPNLPEGRPVLLIFDGHASHVSYKVAMLAEENNIILLKLPPHTTHVLQPLDVAFFKSFKTAWDIRLCKWQRANPRKVIPKSVFIDILNETYNSLPEANLIMGFKKTGIYDIDVLQYSNTPVNRKVIKNEIYNPAELKTFMLRVNKDNQVPHVTAESAEEIINKEDENPRLEPISSETILEDGANMNNRTTTQHESPTSTKPISSETIVEDGANLNNRTIIQNELQTSIIKTTPNTQNQQNTSSTGTSSFENILLDLVKENKQKVVQPTKRRRICTGSEIINTKEGLEKLQKRDEEERIKKAKKEEKLTAKSTPALKKKSGKKTEDSLTSDESSIDLSSEGESDTEEFEYKEGDYVIVQYQEDVYPGQIIEINFPLHKIKHMERSGLLNWRWPLQEDVLDYEIDDIVKKIRPPVQINKRGMFKVQDIA